MEKIVINVEDLNKLIGGLNNALNAYNRFILNNVFFGLEQNIPEDFSRLLDEKVGPNKEKRYEFLKDRQDALLDLYKQLLEAENETKG